MNTVVMYCKRCRSIEEYREDQKICDRCSGELELNKPQFDLVSKPAHYAYGAIECVDAMQSMLSPEEFRGFLRGNSFKYRWRYRHKNGIEDLRKAMWYEDLLMKLEEGVNMKSV